MRHKKHLTKSGSALPRFLLFVILLCPLCAHAFWQSSSKGTVREQYSKSAIQVLDEFVHGSTAIPALAFDQITHDYSKEQLDVKDGALQCKMSEGPACLPLDKYYFQSSLYLKDTP